MSNANNNEPAQQPETALPAPRRRPSPLRLVLPGLILAGALFFGWRWYQHMLLYVSTDNAQLNSDVLPVSTQISGQVVEVLVRENDDVEAGQILIRLDRRSYEIKLQEAEAMLHVARQQAGSAQASISVSSSQARASGTAASGGVSQADASLQAAEAQLSQVQAARDSSAAHIRELETVLAQAETHLDRYRSLARAEIIARQELDDATAARDTARARLDAAREEQSSAEARIEQAEAGIEQATAQQLSSGGGLQLARAARDQVGLNEAQYETALAQVEVAQASVAKAQLDLDNTEIKALRSGRIGRRQVEPGQQISPGQNLLAIVPEAIWVEANFKETQMSRLHPGQAVEIIVDALPNSPLSGIVDSFSPASGATFSLIPPENATGNFTKVVQRIPVRIRIDEDSLQGLREMLTPGMSVVVHVRAS